MVDSSIAAYLATLPGGPPEILCLTETHHLEGDLMGGLIDGYSRSFDSAGTPIGAPAAKEGTSILIHDSSGITATKVKLHPPPNGFRSLVWIL